jgi:hypothetical protein
MDFQPILPPAQLVYPSRSGGDAHTVRITRSRRAGIAGPAGTLYATCDCVAGRVAFRKCWAVKDAVARFAGVVAIAR